LINTYGKHPVSTADGGTWYPPQACRFLKLKYHLHSSLKGKAPWKDQLNTSKTEPMDLTITFHVEKRNVN